MHVLAVVLALLAPPVPPERAPEPDPEEGLLCYWLCMGACVALGNRQDHCDAVCESSCFTETSPPPPSCDPERGSICV